MRRTSLLTLRHGACLNYGSRNVYRRVVSRCTSTLPSIAEDGVQRSAASVDTTENVAQIWNTSHDTRSANACSPSVDAKGDANKRLRSKQLIDAKKRQDYIATAPSKTFGIVIDTEKYPDLLPLSRKIVQDLDGAALAKHESRVNELLAIMDSLTNPSDRNQTERVWQYYAKMRCEPGFIRALKAPHYRRLVWILSQRYDEQRPGSLSSLTYQFDNKRLTVLPELHERRHLQTLRLLTILHDMSICGLSPPFLAYRALLRDAVWLTREGHTEWYYQEDHLRLWKTLFLAHLIVFREKRTAYYAALRDSSSLALLRAGPRVWKSSRRAGGVQVSYKTIHRMLGQSLDRSQDASNKLCFQPDKVYVDYHALVNAALNSRQRALALLLYNDARRLGERWTITQERTLWRLLAERPRPQKELALFTGLHRMIRYQFFVSDQIHRSKNIPSDAGRSSNEETWCATRSLVMADNLTVARNIYAATCRHKTPLPTYLSNRLITHLCDTGQLCAAIGVLSRQCGVSTRGLIITGRRLLDKSLRIQDALRTLPAAAAAATVRANTAASCSTPCRHTADLQHLRSEPDAASFDTIANAFIDRGRIHLARMMLYLATYFGQRSQGSASANIRFKLDIASRWKVEQERRDRLAFKLAGQWTKKGLPTPQLRLWRMDQIRPLGSKYTMAEIALYAWLQRCHARERALAANASVSKHNDAPNNSKPMAEPNNTRSKARRNKSGRNIAPPAHIWPDITSYNICLSTLLTANPDAHLTAAAASRLLTFMRLQRILPNTLTYNILLQLHARRRDLTACLNVLRSMRKAGIQPTPATTTTVIKYADPRWWRRRRYSSNPAASDLSSLMKNIKPDAP